MQCNWIPGEEEGETPCGDDVFYTFVEDKVAFCEEHCLFTYNRYEENNRQLTWYLGLREKFHGDNVPHDS
jgi:hypothetical protein